MLNGKLITRLWFSLTLDTDVSASNRSAMSSERKVDIGDAYAAIEAHKIISLPKQQHWSQQQERPGYRQIAWSNCGKWCVATGDSAMVNIFKRWD